MQINANDFWLCSLAMWTVPPLCQKVNMHAYVTNAMGVSVVPGQKGCDYDNVSAGVKGFGWTPCLDSSKQLGTVDEGAAHAAICQQL